jgi:hypothetical protein
LTQAVRRVGKSALDHVGQMPCPAVQSVFDPLLPPGLQWYWRADFVKEPDQRRGASGGTEWCKQYFDAVHPYSAGGAYVNFMREEGEDRVKASFRDNYARLAAIEKEYDPLNFFRVNQNIRPA